METKIKVPVVSTDTSPSLLEGVMSLLVYSKEWDVEYGDIEKSILIKHRDTTEFIEVIFGSFDQEIEVSICTEQAKPNEFDYVVRTIKGCIDFLLNKQNEQTIKRIMDETSSDLVDLFVKDFERLLSRVDSTLKELEELNNDPIEYFTAATIAIREIVPDIEDIESKYWAKIHPLPKYYDTFQDVEEKINLSLGLGLESIDAAKACFMLMTLWLTKRIVDGIIRWNGDDIQDVPELRPLARQIMALTRKHLSRNSRTLDALILQRAACYFLKDYEGFGEAEHEIAKIRSLTKAGFIQNEKEIEQLDLKKTKRNDGKALEEQIKDLLQSMGLRAATTKATGDGGIDIVAYSDNPIFSGKYVIQCKDWSGSVGESVIRDLYGVVMAESANKGILITTGSITKSAIRFAEGKPLELIDGQQLHILLQEHKSLE